MPPKIGRSHRWEDETRRAFLLLVDRCSSVRAAALSLGISVDLAYKWRNDTVIPAAKRPALLVYTEQDKAEFFSFWQGGVRKLRRMGSSSKTSRRSPFPVVWLSTVGVCAPRMA